MSQSFSRRRFLKSVAAAGAVAVPCVLPGRVLGKDGSVAPSDRITLGGIGVGQKAAALRLQSGALLLCTADTRKPPITGKRGTLAALSHDDGKTWPHIRHLPGVGGYLSAAQTPNGVIHVFGSRMSCVAFNEAWVRGNSQVRNREEAACDAVELPARPVGRTDVRSQEKAHLGNRHQQPGLCASTRT